MADIDGIKTKYSDLAVAEARRRVLRGAAWLHHKDVELGRDEAWWEVVPSGRELKMHHCNRCVIGWYVFALVHDTELVPAMANAQEGDTTLDIYEQNFSWGDELAYLGGDHSWEWLCDHGFESDGTNTYDLLELAWSEHINQRRALALAGNPSYG